MHARFRISFPNNVYFFVCLSLSFERQKLFFSKIFFFFFVSYETLKVKRCGKNLSFFVFLPQKKDI